MSQAMNPAMSAPSEPIFEKMERRLTLMRQLAEVLQQAQVALLASDLSGIVSQTEKQQELCAGLLRLANREPRETNNEAEGVQDATANSRPWITLPDGAVSPALRSRWEVLGRELARVETQVEYLNRVHAGLLRRARRTLDIFVRVLASAALTYAPTPQALTPQLYPRE